MIAGGVARDGSDMRVAVLGAGVTGLVAAYRLAAEGHGCDVYERWPGLGGQVASLEVADGVRLERYYHHLFTSDRHIAALYEELGLPDAIEWLPSSIAMFAEGRSYPFTTPLDLLRFKPLSLRSRIRMGVATLRLQRSTEVEPFERETARSWIERAMGKEAWQKVWGPLLRGKFGDRADDISMAWLWRKLTVRRQITGKEARQERLGYPHGGWEPLLQRLRQEIEARGGRVLIDCPATGIAREGGGFRVDRGAPGSFRFGHDPVAFQPVGEPERYDAVLATVPNDIFMRLLDRDLSASLAPGYLERLASIEYHEALCLLMELDRPFSRFYWTNVADRDLPFVGLIEQTNLVDPERYGGRHFLYVANYLAHGDPLLQLDFDRLLELYEPGLKRMNAGFSGSWVRQRWVFREPAAQPVVTVGYPEKIPPLRTGVAGLVLANTTQIYPEDRGTNYSVRLGSEAARELGVELRSREQNRPRLTSVRGH
jgi:protoporphyrinogen oxidase